MAETVLVTGAGGFIGGHLVKALVDLGDDVRATDVKPLDQWCQIHPGAANWAMLDLRYLPHCEQAVRGRRLVYHLAADVGGMGYIAFHKADCMLNVVADTNVLQSARAADARFYYASTSCVYPGRLQDVTHPLPLREDEVHPADPEDGYGWEKLFMERMLSHFGEDYGMTVRAGRYQSIYGPAGRYRGGREKVPTAVCRKIATAVLTGQHEIELWGDGKAGRNFIYVTDAVAATIAVARGTYPYPLNIGTPDITTVDELVTVVEEIAGVTVDRHYVTGHAYPQGVRGRCSDSSRILRHTGWKPRTSLRAGMERTYAWVLDQVEAGMR